MNKNLIITILAIFTAFIPAEKAYAQGWLKDIQQVITDVSKSLPSKSKTSTSGTNSSNSSNSSSSNDDALRSKSLIEGISIKVKTCKRDENDNVTLVFTLLNDSGKNAECQLRGGSSVAYDDEGNSYQEERLRFASMNDRFQNIIDAKLPNDVAVKYRLKIMDVDPDATMLKQVEIFMYELPIGALTGRVYLYNVPISRPGD